MIADAEPPDGQPEEGQQPFQDQHLLPAIGSQQPAGEGGGRRDGQRLAERPISVGPGAFAAREPVGQQHHGRRKHAAFGHAQQKAHHLELPESARQAAADRADAPGNQEQADDLPGAPSPSPNSRPGSGAARSRRRRCPPPLPSSGRPSAGPSSWTRWWGPAPARCSSGPHTRWCT